MFAYARNPPASANPPTQVYDGHISYGQSWRGIDYPNFGNFNLNPSGPIALLVSSLGGTKAGVPGPLPNSAGISVPGTIRGVTNYAATDTFSIGRTAVLAQQLLRSRDGEKVLQPIVEFCAAWGGSTWHSGRGGGLAPGGNATGSISGTTFTVTDVASGTLVVPGQQLVAADINPVTNVGSVPGTGTGGVGTYSTGLNQSMVAGTLCTGTSPAAVFVAGANIGVLNVSSVTSGTLAVNQIISGGSPPLPAGTVIASLGTGSGGVGSYNLSFPQTVGSETIVCRGQSWHNMVTVLTQAKAAMPYRQTASINWSSIGYTQGGSADGTNAGKVADLTDMLVQYDAMALGSAPLILYLSLPAVKSSAVVYDASVEGTYTFARMHAPGMGGTYSGRVYGTGPNYPLNFSDETEEFYGSIHQDPYSTSRWGEIEGYARWLVQDKGIPWTPLWRPLTGGAITIAGQIITVPFARPSGPDFINGVMKWQNNINDGIKDWPQKGFHVKRSGIDLTVTPTIVDMNVQLVITEQLLSGDTLEVSYAWYGPGGPDPGTNSGVGGNLVMNGPPSVLYPDGWQGDQKTIDAWAWPFIETVTV